MAELSRSDKYRRQEGVLFLSGVEAIVRLLLDKQRRDRDHGDGAVNATFVTGYEGSPLGGFDLELAEHLDLLNELGRTVHRFGINEKTAAAAVLGSQYAPAGDVDAFWYGKAHGALWIPDEAWLANLTGASGRGSMVLLCGEDHLSKSSVSPGTSDWALRSAWVPLFYPACVEEVLALGMHAIALSRWLGMVTALKLVTPVCDGAATVRAEAARVPVRVPDPAYEKRFHPIVMARGALPMQRELVERKVPLAEAYVRANGLNRAHHVDVGGPVGIVATGKSVVDVRRALDLLGARVPLYQMSVTWPVDAEGLRRFAADSGVRRVVVVEEPGPFVETVVQAALWDSGVRQVVGQRDEAGAPLVPCWGEVDPEVLARLLAPRLGRAVSAAGQRHLQALDRIAARRLSEVPAVTPMSCGGCPYNTFGALQGEKPGGAIGCSSIRAIQAYDHGVLYIPTMGAGGSIYSGTAPFNENGHIFQYLGDGSYFHSGRGAVQSCIQDDVNITFLLLYNGAVALTGGQRPGGWRPVVDVVRELLALGVRQVGVVGPSPAAYRAVAADRRVRLWSLAKHAEAIAHFRNVAGTTVLILDKECAAEKGRRRRRAGDEAERFFFIDPEICEGCGDCLRQSEGCAALVPIDTELGLKTRVEQSRCMQDALCLAGQCPAFVSVAPRPGTRPRRRRPRDLGLEELPKPSAPRVLAEGEVYTMHVVGRGGTGVVTLSHLVAWAALRDDLRVYLSNNTGLAQKGGPVEAPIQLGRGRQPVFHRLLPGSADLYMGCDLLRAAEATNLRLCSPERTLAVVSTTRIPTAGLNRHPERDLPEPDTLAAAIDGVTASQGNVYVDTGWLAEALFGDVLFANVLLLGAAWQAGLVPLRASSIEAAIVLNDRSVEANVQAFRWGRLAVADPERLRATVGLPRAEAASVVARAWARMASRPQALGLHEAALTDLALSPEAERAVSHRLAGLVDYQDLTLARRYVEHLRHVRSVVPGDEDLILAVACSLYRLWTYKDEYEVARLAVEGSLERDLRSRFDGPVRVARHLHPPGLRRLGLGRLRVGTWALPLLRLLSRCRALRGTRLDPFGRTRCRRLERELITWYDEVLDQVLAALEAGADRGLALRILAAPEGIRGYEGVKMAAAVRVRGQVAGWLRQLRAPAVG